MAQKLYEESNIQAIAQAIRDKNGLTTTYKTSEMAAAISAIPSGGGDSGIPEEAFHITGNCQYRFANGNWDWFLENYGDKITTENLTNVKNMCEYSTLEIFPFEFNVASTATDLDRMFFECVNLKEAPTININSTGKVKSVQQLFSSCYSLRHLPDLDAIIDWGTITSRYTDAFRDNYSARTLPTAFYKHSDPNSAYYYSYFSSLTGFHALDELVNLPVPYTATWTSNGFGSFCRYCSRLARITFETPNGQPVKVNWKSQTMDLTYSVGFGNYPGILKYNSGITEDKLVHNAATYQALKNDPDWYSIDYFYSRYNHDSAVETINSLPDASEYLASAGGTNTIKFRGDSGMSTDGGAINTLTEAEIAVAAAKGWTVTFA